MKKMTLFLLMMIFFTNVLMTSGCSRAHVFYYRTPSPEEKVVFKDCMRVAESGGGNIQTRWGALVRCMDIEKLKVEWKCGALEGVPTCKEAKELLEKEGWVLFGCSPLRSHFYIFDIRWSTDGSQDLLRPYRHCPCCP